MSTRYRVNPEVVYRPEGDEGAILFDPDTSQVQVLNTAGAFIWERLADGLPLDGLEGAIAELFDEPPPAEQLRKQVDDFVGVLLRQGLLAEVEA